MSTFNELKDTTVSGRVLKEILKKNPGDIFVKVTNKEKNHLGFPYSIGKNTDKFPLNSKRLTKGGLHFTTFSDIANHIYYGDGYHEVTFDDDEDVFVEGYEFKEGNNFKARNITLGPKILFSELPTSKWIEILSTHGAAIRFCSKEIKSNEEIALAAVTNDWRALDYCSNEIKNNEKICSITIKQNTRALDYCSNKNLSFK